MRFIPLLQDLVDLFLAVHLHLLQTLQVITVLKRYSSLDNEIVSPSPVSNKPSSYIKTTKLHKADQNNSLKFEINIFQ
jgi:hypothetical protein